MSQTTSGTPIAGAAKPAVTLVVPMYNEERAIETNVTALAENLDGLAVTWEMIVVNDGSTDGSAGVVGALSERDRRIRLVSYGKNRGRGHALRQGFDRAAGRYVISTEADLSWGAGIVTELYRALEKSGCDMVVATPYLPGGSIENVPWFRHAISRGGNKILSLSLDGKVTMVSGMTRGYRREILEVLDLEADGKEIHLEILSKVIAVGGQVTEIPARLRWDPGAARERAGRSTFKLRKFVFSHLLFSFEEYPILLFGTLGGALFVLGFLLGLWALVLSLQGHPVGSRPLTLASVLFLLFGLQILVFAFLAIQMRKQSRRIVRLTGLVKRMEGARQRGGDDVQRADRG